MTMNVLLVRYSPYWAAPVLDRDDVKLYVVHERTPQGLGAEALARFERVYYVSSFDALEELSAVAADLISEDVAIDKVMSSNEFSQYAAAHLAHLLGADEPSASVVLATRDKRLMKHHARRAGLHTARTRSVPDPAALVDAGDEALAELESAVGYPAVVKPANGWGTVSTTVAHDRDALRSALRDFRYAPELRSQQLLVEEFIDGEEFHVDAVWRDGEPWIFCVSRYVTPPLRLREGAGPGLSVLLDEEDHADLYAEVRELHRRLNEQLGLTRGPTHLEFFRERGTGRLVFSEIASRLGGLTVAQLVGAGVGVDEREIAAHEMLDGELSQLPLRRCRFRYVGMLNIIPDRSGRVTRVPAREDLLAHDHVLDVSVGPGVGAEVVLGQSSASVCVMVVYGADSEDDLLKTGAELARDHPVEVE
ncbi:ATP-grasp domain-containing protein [Streptantibioticus parmotrematis]|uniref:ATP-grasp domain-containing protein n=1 Tax=Streptantibioticus parmotrematis TaxID=2873249 RepID=UPI0033E41474